MAIGVKLRRRGSAAVIAVPFALLACSSFEANGPGEDDATITAPDAGTLDAKTADALAPDRKIPLPNVTFLSGTRLKANYIRAGSAKLLVNWHDALLNQDCDFALDPMGKLRCFPIGVIISDFAFADATCKEPVAYASQCSEKSTAYTFDPSTCGRTAYKAGVLTQKQQHFNFGTCMPGQDLDPSTALVTTVGAARSPSEFVGATIAVENFGTLGRRVVRADDGASYVAGAQDTTLSVPCSQSFSEQRSTCDPAADSYDPVFRSEDCTGPRYFGLSKTSCTTTKIGSMREGCSLRFFRLGAVVASPPKLGHKTDSCYVQDSAFNTERIAPAEDEVTVLPPVSFSLIGDTDAKIVQLRDGASNVLDARSFYDDKHEVPCTLVRDKDGVPRCMPAVYPGEYFRDAACKQRVFVQARSGCSKLTPYASLLKASGCESRATPIKVGAKISDDTKPSWPVFLIDQAGKCIVIDFQDTHVYTATEVPASEFAELSNQRDP
jgi:hypothetical protein